MLHKTLKAATTATDQGVFTALASTFAVDRVKDQVLPGAFANTIKAWQSSGKRIPLLWNHSGLPEHGVGWVEPKSMKETDEGLYVEGQLDLENSEVARTVWQSMRNNTVALSFGYMEVKGRKGKGGIREVVEVDLFEITIAPGPINPETRFLTLKAAVNGEVATEEETDEHAEVEETEPPKQELEDLSAETPAETVEDGSDEEPVEAKSAPQDPLKKRTDELALEIANGGMKVRKHIEPDEPEPDPEPLNEAELRRRSNELALEIARGY